MRSPLLSAELKVKYYKIPKIRRMHLFAGTDGHAAKPAFSAKRCRLEIRSRQSGSGFRIATHVASL